MPVAVGTHHPFGVIAGRRCLIRIVRVLTRYVPILSWLPRYRPAWLRDDGVAAISVWALLVPQALAYATIAGVPVQYGLYTAFACLIAYAIFGTSRQVVQGPSATVAAVSTVVITPLAGAAAIGTDAAAPWAAALALVTGGVYLVCGILRLGWISNFISRAVLAGFIFGFALGIIIDQSPKVLGVSVGEGSYAEELLHVLGELGNVSLSTLAVGAACLAVLLPLRYRKPRWPRALLVVVLATAAAAAFNLDDHGVALTGDVPTGLFSVGIPDVDAGDIGKLAVGAVSVVFVGFAETLAAGRTMASRHSYEIDLDQELIAQGVACGAAGFAGGFVNDGSLSKTSVADAAGQRTQMASLINAAFVLLTMVLLAGLFDQLPTAALGSDRHRRDGRPAHARRRPPVLPDQSLRLARLRRRDGRDPVLRDHRRDRRRRRALTAAAGRARVRPRGPGPRPPPRVRRLPRPRASHQPRDDARGARRPSRRAAVLRQRRWISRPDPSSLSLLRRNRSTRW